MLELLQVLLPCEVLWARVLVANVAMFVELLRVCHRSFHRENPHRRARRQARDSEACERWWLDVA